jgi:hypothetical protein
MSSCGSGPLCTCFTDLSGISGLYYNQYQSYAASWEIFRRVELYNSNVSTQRGQGNLTLDYYQFPTNQELSAWRTGQQFFFTYLGYSTVVQKN